MENVMYFLLALPALAIVVMVTIFITDDLTLWDWLPKKQSSPEPESVALILVTEE
jgi:hypothetical protein